MRPPHRKDVHRVVRRLSRHVFCFVMGDAIDTGTEDQRRRRNTMRYSMHHPAMLLMSVTYASCRRGVAHQLRTRGIKHFVAEGPSRRDLTIDIRFFRSLFQCLTRPFPISLVTSRSLCLISTVTSAYSGRMPNLFGHICMRDARFDRLAQSPNRYHSPQPENMRRRSWRSAASSSLSGRCGRIRRERHMSAHATCSRP